MNGWNDGIANAIAYMEEHLTEPLDMEQIAAKAYVSSFYFQKIFHALCGLTVGEYLKNRRLTLAAQEICSTDRRILDIALKYGYDSPDGFTRAFTKFHGISPSAARKKGCTLRSFAPLKIKLTLEGGNMLEYQIVEKAAFTVMGICRHFEMETAYKEIPQFWEECMQAGDDRAICGMYGISMNVEGNGFDYLIADNYIPWENVPEGCKTEVIPAGTWAVFPCRGELPEALQSVNTKIWSEWLPSCKNYKLAGNYSIEMYTAPTEGTKVTYSEIWVPVEKV